MNNMFREKAGRFEYSVRCVGGYCGGGRFGRIPNHVQSYTEPRSVVYRTTFGRIPYLYPFGRAPENQYILFTLMFPFRFAAAGWIFAAKVPVARQSARNNAGQNLNDF